MRAVKLFLLAAVAALGPGSCLNSPMPPRDLESGLSVAPLPDAPRAGAEIAPGVRWLEGWRLSSPNYHFGGYSAAAIRRDGRLMLGSDRGRLLIFDPDREGVANARFDWLHATADADKHMSDLEALTLDPATGAFWAAFELRNMILKLGEDEQLLAHATPPEMEAWPVNAGPESLARLPDGRFVVVSESVSGWFGGAHAGVVFTGDPAVRTQGLRFTLDVPDGFSPVELAVLPDGRWLFLLRKLRWALPPGFESALLLVDPPQIEEGMTVKGRLLRFNDRLPRENYEGLAIAPSDGGGAIAWMVSDDNMAYFQRTLLVKLRIELVDPAKEKARRPTARPSGSVSAPKGAH